MYINQNIQLPLALFNKITSFFEYLNLTDCKFPQIFKFEEILSGLREKQHSINKRTAYSDIIYSRDDKRKEALDNYQQLKRRKIRE